MTGSENIFLSTSCGDGKESPVMAVHGYGKLSNEAETLGVVTCTCGDIYNNISLENLLGRRR